VTESSDGQEDHELEALLSFIRDSRGFDFTGYKRSSLARRIRKRMNDISITGYIDYRDRLETDAEEFGVLLTTVLINVTGFFRDTDSWTYLKGDIIPDLLAHRDADEEIRVWSAGCSSGEEAYSLAITFAEVMGIDECLRRVKIYGTDVDDEALREARTGLYPPRALEPLPAELAGRYFESSGAHLAFHPELRRRVIFGRHDITRDAPISRLDLLVCRNTLMYFNVEAQSQIIDRFHFALRPGGYLFLGKAEMLLSANDRFEVASMRQRIFKRRPGDAIAASQLVSPRADPESGDEVREASRKRQLRDMLLDTSASPVLAIGIDGTVSVINSQARTQFGLSIHDVGRPLHELEVSYRPIELRSLIEQAETERRIVRANNVERRLPGGEIQVFDVIVHALTGPQGLPVGVAVTFIDTTATARLHSELRRVREDLETAYEELQSTNEELETTNEELQSSIEELETTNEELQSTNEELETTNEELQSGNEELETMNEEMRIRTTEVDEARGFLEGVLSSVAAGVVVLDVDMRVRSWNRGAEDLWGLRADEVDRQPFFSLDFGLPISELHGPLKKCAETGRKSEPLILAAVNRIGRTITCSVTCSPLDGRGGGVVLLMEEVPQP
jgi:two-component system, chemotaxis family, CheB/CheR fusion protein